MSDVNDSQLRPNTLIDNAPMSIWQWLVVLICVFAMALDGYDVMSIALAAPELVKEWGLTKVQTGFILPLEFLGVAIGAIFIGMMSDFFGRRFVILLCLLIMSCGMLISAYSPDFIVLGISRVVTGMGIGGILASATAMSSEFSNKKNRSLAVILVAGGYTLGIFLASKFAGLILEQSDWRAIFEYGAYFSLIFIPIVWFLVPESVALQERRNDEKSRASIRKTLNRFGIYESFECTEKIQENEKVSPGVLLKGTTGRITTVMAIFYLGNILTYYFFIKWMPPSIVDIGYSSIQGTEILATISLVGLFGSVAMAVFSRIFSLKLLMIISLLGSAVSVALFPLFTTSLEAMHLLGGIAGFWLYAVISGAFGMFSQSFAPTILASGTGLVLGLGRGGAYSGPVIGGLLFGSGMSLIFVSPIMALGSLIAAVSLFFLPKNV
jgi:MFS family permease